MLVSWWAAGCLARLTECVLPWPDLRCSHPSMHGSLDVPPCKPNQLLSLADMHSCFLLVLPRLRLLSEQGPCAQAPLVSPFNPVALHPLSAHSPTCAGKLDPVDADTLHEAQRISPFAVASYGLQSVIWAKGK